VQNFVFPKARPSTNPPASEAKQFISQNSTKEKACLLGFKKMLRALSLKNKIIKLFFIIISSLNKSNIVLLPVIVHLKRVGKRYRVELLEENISKNLQYCQSIQFL
jgi:hypothetical protein